MKYTSLHLALVSLAMCFLALGQSVNLKPGKYETTAETVRSGSPVKMPELKNVECMSEADLKNFVEKRTAHPGNCTVSALRVSADNASYTVKCLTNGKTTTGKSEWSFASDSFQHVLETTTSNGRVITTRITGKRIGDCTNP